jgi:hypothetical protein
MNEFSAMHLQFDGHQSIRSLFFNLMERWLGEITRKRIRRGVFKSVSGLVAAIQEFIRLNSDNPKPFVWTKKVEEILEKVNHCKTVIETPH